MIGASAISASAAYFSISSRTKLPSLNLFFHRPYSDSSTSGLSLRIDERGSLDAKQSYVTVKAKGGNPPIMPAVMTPGGPLDLSSVLFRNRIIFIGQPINSQVAQRVISQLVTLATIDEKTDILMYLNCPGGSTYSVLAIYDCMSWIKPKVGTVCFGVAASQGALLLAGGEKGMRYAMPNARIMIHQPQGGCGVRINFLISLMLFRIVYLNYEVKLFIPEVSVVMFNSPFPYSMLARELFMHGHVEDVRRQVNEAVQARHVKLETKSFLVQFRAEHCTAVFLKLKFRLKKLDLFCKHDISGKIDQMYAVFTGQPLEKVQQYTERDRFLSTSEVRGSFFPFDVKWSFSDISARLWSLGSLMASWKQNIKLGSLRFIIECGVEVGYIFDVKMSCLRFFLAFVIQRYQGGIVNFNAKCARILILRTRMVQVLCTTKASQHSSEDNMKLINIPLSDCRSSRLMFLFKNEIRQI
ncbi:hypothetical protein DKX38_014396 [Salix brachista]|uniref:ATP-dependent Clp protease proteolytic subunit n=1 Tax=Salix brachista TaxID=2182728 RepID=A0A5N5LFM6_9ROSI|nr:hypothetical protein DKX38_014396 [Salix brachista]